MNKKLPFLLLVLIGMMWGGECVGAANITGITAPSTNADICPGDSFNVTINYTGYANGPETFLVVLSDINGLFNAVTTVIGSRPVNINGDASVTIKSYIPRNIPSDNGYKLKVIDIGNKDSAKKDIHVLPVPGITPQDTVICQGINFVSIAYSGMSGGATKDSLFWSSSAISQGFANSTASLNGTAVAISNIPTQALAGIDSAILVVYNSNGCSSRDYLVKLTVKPKPVINKQYGTNGPTTCNGNDGKIKLQAVPADSTYTVAYQSGSFGSIKAIKDTISVTGLMAGSYPHFQIALRGCSSDFFPSSGSIDLSDPQKPSVSITENDASGKANNDNISCSGENVNLSALPTGVKYSYDWGNNAKGVDTLVKPTTGTPSYTVTVTDNTTNCSASKSISITVNPLPTPVFTGTPPSDGCLNSQKFTYCTTAGQSQYSWNVPGGSFTGAAECIEVTWSSTGSHTITLNYTDTKGCTALTPASKSVTVHNPPTLTPNPSGDTTICQFESVLLNANATGTGLNFDWDPNGPSTGTNLVHRNATGDSTYTVTATDGFNCFTSHSFKVKATQTLTPTNPIAVDPTGIICLGSGIDLTSNATQGVSPTYKWIKTGEANPISTAKNFSYTPVDGDSGKVIKCIMYAHGCSTADSVISSDIVVKVVKGPQSPELKITPSLVNTVCAGATLSIDNTKKGSGGVQPIDSFIYKMSGSNSIINYTAPFQVPQGVDSITLQSFRTSLTNGTGCSNAPRNKFVIQVAKTPKVTIEDKSFCQGTSDTIRATLTGGTGNFNYSWFIRESGGGFVSQSNTSANFIVDKSVLAKDYDYKVSITYTDKNLGCRDTFDVASVKVKPLPDVPDFSTPKDTVCSGAGGVSFTLNNNLGNNFSYNWSGSNATLITPSNAPNATFNIGKNSAQISLEVTNKTTSCKRSNSKLISVTSIPAPDTVTVDILLGFLVCHDQSVGTTHQWGFTDKKTFEVHLIEGETGPDCPKPVPFNTDQFAYWVETCRGTCCTKSYFNQLTGIDELLADFNLRVYPNPTSGYLKIEADGYFSRVTIADVTGKSILDRQTGKTLSAELQLQDLPRGIYFVRIYTVDNIAVSRKIVIQ